MRPAGLGDELRTGLRTGLRAGLPEGLRAPLRGALRTGLGECDRDTVRSRLRVRDADRAGL